jgi:hypothetical protein
MLPLVVQHRVKGCDLGGSSTSPSADRYPHVVPTSYAADSTLFYFTTSEHPEDVQDLWVKHAQVYLVTSQKGDVAAASATQVVFTNFSLSMMPARTPTLARGIFSRFPTLRGHRGKSRSTYP